MTKEVTSLRIDENVMERIRQEAKRDNRGISNYIETVLLRHIENIDLKKENPDD
jgi:hypothetical protein